LHHDEPPAVPDFAERLIALWEWWEQIALKRDDATELAAFGWWFTSSAFESSWLLPKLTRLLDVTRGELDWDHEVAEKLASLAESMPNEVAECLAKFIETAPDHRVYHCMASIQSVLRTLATGPAAASGRSMSSRLVARGWPEFQTTA
jgi:hypothetical protein